MKTSPGDRAYLTITTLCAASIPAVLLLVAIVVVRGAWPVLATHAGDFLTGTRWNVPQGQFGAWPVAAGTLASAIGAVLIAAPLGIGAALFTTEVAPRALRAPVAFLLNLLAAIPSVVYGLWGLFVLVPFLRTTIMPGLMATGLSVFHGPAYGPSLLAAVLILALMILPYVAGVSRDVLQAVPDAQREAALALGATRWEMIRDAVLPTARSGLAGATILGLARALGETMAVTMVIGNRHAVARSLLDPAYTMAALLANEFAEASTQDQIAALMGVTALLLLITIAVNLVARLLVARVAGNDARLLPT